MIHTGRNQLCPFWLRHAANGRRETLEELLEDARRQYVGLENVLIQGWPKDWNVFLEAIAAFLVGQQRSDFPILCGNRCVIRGSFATHSLLLRPSGAASLVVSGLQL